MPAVQQVPPELWLLMLGYLDPISAVSTALTCRSLYHAIGPAPFLTLSSDRSTRLEFLTKLSPALPDYWLCSTCCVWHAFRRSFWVFGVRVARPRENCFDRGGLGHHGVEQGRIVELTLHAELDIMDAMSAVRYYKYGPRYGKPLEHFENRRLSKKDQRSSSMSSKVVDESLLIKTTQSTLDGDSVRTIVGQYQHEWFFTGVCEHSEITVKWAFPAMVQILEDPNLKYPANNYQRFFTELHRCSKCPSEYVIELCQSVSNQRPVWTWTVHKWMDLGDCIHVDSPLWRLNTPWHWDGLAGMYDLRDTPSIRDRFESLNLQEWNKSLPPPAQCLTLSYGNFSDPYRVFPSDPLPPQT